MVKIALFSTNTTVIILYILYFILLDATNILDPVKLATNSDTLVNLNDVVEGKFIPWERLYNPRLFKLPIQKAKELIGKRHELHDWEHPPLSEEDIINKQLLLSVLQSIN